MRGEQSELNRGSEGKTYLAEDGLHSERVETGPTLPAELLVVDLRELKRNAQ